MQLHAKITTLGQEEGEGVLTFRTLNSGRLTFDHASPAGRSIVPQERVFDCLGSFLQAVVKKKYLISCRP